MQTPESIRRLFEQFVNEAAVDQAVSLYEPSAVLIERDGKLVSRANAIRQPLASLLALCPRMSKLRAQPCNGFENQKGSTDLLIAVFHSLLAGRQHGEVQELLRVEVGWDWAILAQDIHVPAGDPGV